MIQAAFLGFLSSVFGVPRETNPKELKKKKNLLGMISISIKFSYMHYEFGAIFFKNLSYYYSNYHILFRSRNATFYSSSYP